MMDYPESIMKASRKAHAEWANSGNCENLEVIIAKALMNERDRCAQFARKRIVPRSPELSDQWNGYRMAAVCIEIDILSEDEDC